MSRTETELLGDEALYDQAITLGDHYAQHCFTDRFRPRILGYARQWVDTASLAEEVCAEVLRKIIVPGSPREVTSVAGLLHVATRNTAYTLLDRRRRERVRSDATAEHLQAVREHDTPPSSDELDALTHDTLIERLRQGIAQLKPAQRASGVLLLREPELRRHRRGTLIPANAGQVAPPEWPQASSLLAGALGCPRSYFRPPFDSRLSEYAPAVYTGRRECLCPDNHSTRS